MRRRIVGLAVWASVLTIALFGIPLAVGMQQYAMADERDDLEQVADRIAIAVAADVFGNDPVDEGQWQMDRVVVTVYDERGALLAGYGPLPGGSAVQQAITGRSASDTEDGDLVVAVPITHDADVIGVVRAAAPRSLVLQRLVPIWTVMAGLAGLVIAAVWLVARGQARRLARPLEQLSTNAERLGDGDFSVRTRPGGIPEIDAVGSALNSTAARLDDLLAKERAFSADASHQLRTPLAGLRLRLEAALEQRDEDLRPAIEASLTEADRLEQTIDELLALARDSRGTPRHPVDLRALVEEINHDWHGQLASRGRSMIFRTDPGTPSPIASAAAVRQVLRVLIDNAATHGAGTVAVTIRESTEAVAIDIADEGGGVEPDAEPFTRRTARSDGHGIGLALARRLAEAEGGRLQLTQPRPPVFTLLLPAVRNPAALPAEPRSAARAAESYERAGESGPGASSR